MLRLSATRTDLNGSFLFSIEAERTSPVVTRSPAKAAKLLSRMGVRDPMRMVEHVQVWGAVDIAAHVGPSPM